MDNNYSYLEPEDIACAKAFRLCEDSFIEAAGGFRKYTQLRLDREAARGAQLIVIGEGSEKHIATVNPLPSTPELALSKFKLSERFGVKPEQIVAELLKEQQQTASGILGAVKAGEELEKARVNAQKQAEDVLNSAASRLAKSYPDYDSDNPEPCEQRARAEIRRQRRW